MIVAPHVFVTRALVEMPSASQIAAIVGGIGLLAQQFGWVQTSDRANANRDANYTCQDALLQERADNKRLLDKLLEHQ